MGPEAERPPDIWGPPESRRPSSNALTMRTLAKRSLPRFGAVPALLWPVVRRWQHGVRLTSVREDAVALAVGARQVENGTFTLRKLQIDPTRVRVLPHRAKPLGCDVLDRDPVT